MQILKVTLSLVAAMSVTTAKAATGTDDLGPLPTRILQVEASDDCQHVLIVSQLSDGQALSLDGKQVAKESDFRGIGIGRDGSRYLYAAAVGEKFKYVLDGKPVGSFDDVGGYRARIGRVALFSFSPDGRRCGFQATRGQDIVTVIDGNIGPSFADAWWLTFSPDSKHFAYAAHQNDGRFVVVVDGKVDDSWHTTSAITDLKFAPDNRRIFFQTGDQIVFDGKIVGPKVDCIITPVVFSGDSEHFAYGIHSLSPLIAGSPLKSAVVVDGIPHGLEPIVFEDSPVTYRVAMSSDGKRVAYDRWDAVGSTEIIPSNHGVTRVTHTLPLVVIDGKVGPRLEDVGDIKFSPDGRHVAYYGKVGGKWSLFLDDKQGEPYDDISRFTFSPDSKHWAFCAERNSQWLVIVDGIAVPGYAPLPYIMPGHADDDHGPTPLAFNSNGELCFLAEKEGELYRVHWKEK